MSDPGLGSDRNARAVVCLRACTFLLIISTIWYPVSNPNTRESGVCFATSARSPCSSPTSGDSLRAIASSSCPTPSRRPHSDVPGCAAWLCRSQTCSCRALKSWSSTCSTKRGRDESAVLCPHRHPRPCCLCGPRVLCVCGGCVQSSQYGKHYALSATHRPACSGVVSFTWLSN